MAKIDNNTNEKQKLINQLNELIITHQHSPDNQVLAAAGVLATLAGALCSNDTEKLMLITAKFSEGAIKRLTASQN